MLDLTSRTVTVVGLQAETLALSYFLIPQVACAYSQQLTRHQHQVISCYSIQLSWSCTLKAATTLLRVRISSSPPPARFCTINLACVWGPLIHMDRGTPHPRLSSKIAIQAISHLMSPTCNGLSQLKLVWYIGCLVCACTQAVEVHNREFLFSYTKNATKNV